MRSTTWLIAVSLLPTVAFAADAPQFAPRRGSQISAWELEARAVQAYPRRRDEPLRYLNMTDDEVREIQVIAHKYEIPALINISPVVTGCPCEEGAGCTEQVYISGTLEGRPLGLLLSRRKNLWTVGVVQKWWLEYAALQAREQSMERAKYQEARLMKLLEFPNCARERPPE